jgi:RNA polymerase sigma-70 factor (ECF subfamily)
MGPVSLSAERALYDRLVAGEVPVLAEVYDQFAPVVFGMALRVTADRSAAEDVTQAVFLELWRRPQRFDPDKGSLRPWLAALAHHRGVDWVRSEEASRRRDGRAAQISLEGAPGIDETVDAILTAEHVRLALAALPERQRTPIRLAYFGGSTYRQIADELALPEGTIKSRIQSGLRQMANTMHSEVAGQAT